MGEWGDKAKQRQRNEWSSVLYDALWNVPGSAWQFAQDVTQPIRHPIETAGAVGRMAAGAAEKIPGASYLTPGPAYDIAGEKPRSAEIDAMIDHFSDRYGSVDGFKRAVAEDPVGVLADVATVLTGGGKALETAGKLGQKVPALTRAGVAAEKVGEVTQKVGQFADPLQIGRRTLQALPAEGMYQSAAKFSTMAAKGRELSKDVRLKMTRAALENRISPTYKGVDRLVAKIRGLDEQIDKLVRLPTEQGVLIPAEELLKHFDDLEREAWRQSPRGVTHLKEVKSIKKEFQIVHGIFEKKIMEDGDVVDVITSHPADRRVGEVPEGSGWKLIGFESLTPEQIQRKKVKTYKKLKKAYESTLEGTYSIKAQKALARGAKDILGDLVPEIKKLNKKYGPMQDLLVALDRASSRITNRDLFGAGIGLPIKTGVGYHIGGEAGGALGFAWGLVDQPAVKAKLAILLYDLQKKGKIADANAVLAELGLYQAGKAERIAEDGRMER